MPYIGNQHIVGDSVNNFKVLDDISSFTATFDGSAGSVVSTANETIKVLKHRFVQGQRVTYSNGGGSNIGGLTSGTAYYIIYDTAHTIKLATSASNAASLTAINLNAVGGGTSHTLNVAFDGVNTKFRITHSGGNRPRFHHATQLNIAINNVIQKPNDGVFTEGYAVEVRDIIVFKTAPTSDDIFFGSLTGETRGSFEITDHKIDSYTGDGSTTLFDLSQNVPNNESLLVTLNGVVQHPTTSGVTGSYEIVSGVSNKLQFTTAPALGVDIQIRHLGFAAASTGDVSGFYGRTGNVSLTDTDDIVVNTAKVGGATTFTEDLVVTGNARVTGILTVGTGSLTITDRDINAVGVVTGSNFKTGSSNLHSTGLNVGNTFLHSTGVEVAGVNVLGADTPIGTGATIYDSGAAVFTGVVTATQFKGDGSELTGVSGFSTALSNDTSSLLNQIFKTNVQHNIGAGTSVTIQSDIGSGNIAFTRLQQINVATGATVHVAAGTTFLMNVLNVF